MVFVLIIYWLPEISVPTVKDFVCVDIVVN